MQIAVLGIDLGKNSCSVAGQDAAGHRLRAMPGERRPVLHASFATVAVHGGAGGAAS
jgi:hypothetical protein